VVGGGCAGMIAAGTAALYGKRVLLLEKNPMLGKKMRITGKGRCNITNNCDGDEFIRNVPVNGRFLYSAYHNFTSQDAMQLLENLGLPLKTERGNRVFPVSDRAADVVWALERYMKQGGVEIRQAQVQHICVDDGVAIGVELTDGTFVAGVSVLVATGGCSYQGTGSTGDGYRFAREVGHSVVPVRPSLVPLNTRQQFCRDLQGLSLRNIAIIVYNETGEKLYSDFGEMLFTHFGVSGPVILSASAHMRDFENHRYHLLLDLKPALDVDTLDKRLQRDFAANPRKEFQNGLDALLPRKLIPVMVRLSEIPPQRKIAEITRQERRSFAELLKKVRIDIASPRDINEAIVTSGGVAVQEINPKTMESKRVAGLFFAGEVLDVDAYTGGFNLQIAMSTGYTAGCHM
jgi:predicted Rossmann fold flavoprotein